MDGPSNLSDISFELDVTQSPFATSAKLQSLSLAIPLRDKNPGSILPMALMGGLHLNFSNVTRIFRLGGLSLEHGRQRIEVRGKVSETQPWSRTCMGYTKKYVRAGGDMGPSIYDVHTEGGGGQAQVDACGRGRRSSPMWTSTQKIKIRVH